MTRPARSSKSPRVSDAVTMLRLTFHLGPDDCHGSVQKHELDYDEGSDRHCSLNVFSKERHEVN